MSFRILLIATLISQALSCYNDEKAKEFAMLDMDGNGYLSLEEMSERVDMETADWGVMLWDLNKDDQVSCQGGCLF